ncbi:hypothetical protein NMY22_g3428 [Coprinellus aureogranulatus]|nr:hypothetical protein NMY22_g3428 [Coprinellus aureogranulatus]
MSEFYIPPPEISARILNYAGTHVLAKGSKSWHERMGNYTPVSQTSASTDSDDQYWSFERSGGFTVCLVRNKTMNQVILASSDPKPCPIYFADGSLKGSASSCSFITLEPGKGKYDGYFRMVRICSDNVVVIVSKSSGLETVTGAKVSDISVSSDQYFSFDYEPMEVVSIDYDLKESRRFDVAPHILVDTYLSNDTGSEQTLTYELNEKTATTSKWDYKVGIKLGITKKVKTGVPKMAEGELSFDASFTAEWAQGKAYTTEQAWKAAFPVKAKAGERVRAKSTVWMGKFEVPYTLKMKNQAGHQVEQKGIWHGVLAWNLRHELKAETADGKEIRNIPV